MQVSAIHVFQPHQIRLIGLKGVETGIKCDLVSSDVAGPLTMTYRLSPMCFHRGLAIATLKIAGNIFERARLVASVIVTLSDHRAPIEIPPIDVTIRRETGSIYLDLLTPLTITVKTEEQAAS